MDAMDAWNQWRFGGVFPRFLKRNGAEEMKNSSWLRITIYDSVNHMEFSWIFRLPSGNLLHNY